MSDFYSETQALALPYLRQRGIPDSAVHGFVAQIAAETGTGSAHNYQARNNWAGIRGAPVTAGNTRGYITYADKNAGMAAYFGLLDRRYGKVLEAARSGDPTGVAMAFGQSPWAGTRYRLGADGTNDKAVDAGAVLGRVGTEGQALLPFIARSRGVKPGVSDRGQQDFAAIGRHVYGQLISQGLDPSQYNLRIEGSKAYAIPKVVA